MVRRKTSNRFAPRMAISSPGSRRSWGATTRRGHSSRTLHERYSCCRMQEPAEHRYATVLPAAKSSGHAAHFTGIFGPYYLPTDARAGIKMGEAGWKYLPALPGQHFDGNDSRLCEATCRIRHRLLRHFAVNQLNCAMRRPLAALDHRTGASAKGQCPLESAVQRNDIESSVHETASRFLGCRQEARLRTGGPGRRVVRIPAGALRNLR